MKMTTTRILTAIIAVGLVLAVLMLFWDGAGSQSHIWLTTCFNLSNVTQFSPRFNCTANCNSAPANVTATQLNFDGNILHYRYDSYYIKAVYIVAANATPEVICKGNPGVSGL